MATPIKRPIVMLITENPFQTHRPAEALRIALGLGSGGDIIVTVILRGEAARLLTDDVEEACDGEELAEHYLPVFREWGTTFLVDEAATRYLDNGRTDFPFTVLSEADIATALANAGRVMIF